MPEPKIKVDHLIYHIGLLVLGVAFYYLANSDLTTLSLVHPSLLPGGGDVGLLLP